MMSDGFRSQMPPQQQQLPGQQQFPPQQQPIQSQPPFQLQQQLMANAGGPTQPPQQPMSMQGQPYGIQAVQQPPMHIPIGGGAPTGPPPTVGASTIPNQISAPVAAPTAGANPTAGGGQAPIDNTIFHPIPRAKALMVDLKQALQALMKTAAESTKDQIQSLGDAAATASSGSTGDTPVAASIPEENSGDELRKSLDLFDSVCDQIEANFMILQDLHREQQSGDRFTPATVLANGQKSEDVIPEGGPPRPLMSYKDYDDLTRIQAQFGSSIRESFAECSRFLENQ